MRSLQTNPDLFPRRGSPHCKCQLPHPAEVTPLKPTEPGDWHVYGRMNVPSGHGDDTLPESLRDDLCVRVSRPEGWY